MSNTADFRFMHCETDQKNCMSNRLFTMAPLRFGDGGRTQAVMEQAPAERLPISFHNNFYAKQNNLLGDTQSTKTDWKRNKAKGRKVIQVCDENFVS